MGSVFLTIGRAYVSENFYVTSMPPSDRSAMGKAYTRYPDGSAVNTALALKKLGVHSWMSTKVGDDSFGEVITQICNRLGVFTPYVSKTTNAQTGICAVITEDLKVSRKIIFEGANRLFSEAEVEQAFSSDPDYLILNADIPDSALRAAGNLAKEKRTKTLLNVFGESGQNVQLESLCPVEILVMDSLNVRRRTDLMPGDSSVNMRICSALSNQISATYYVIRCPDGSTYAYDGTYYFVSTPIDYEPMDRTGCDEVFAAALLLKYLLNNDIKLACDFALLAEAAVSQRPAGITSFPTLNELKDFSVKNNFKPECFQ